MNTNFGLRAEERELICGVLKNHTEVTSAKIFGSRAKGNFRHNSDIDLALSGDIPFLNIARIAGELDDLPLPYKFDIQAYDSVRHTPLLDHIDRVGMLFYSREE